MQTVTITRRYDADPETVWAQVADITLIENWHPGLASVDLLSEQPAGLGATRRCNFYDGSSLVEEFVEVGPRRARLQIREFSMPMNTFESEWSARAAPGGGTELTVEMRYEVKFGALGRLMNLIVIRNKMPRLVGKVLAGLDHHLRTGELVGQDFQAA